MEEQPVSQVTGGAEEIGIGSPTNIHTSTRPHVHTSTPTECNVACTVHSAKKMCLIHAKMYTIQLIAVSVSVMV